jgi:hypothetical protein
MSPEKLKAIFEFCGWGAWYFSGRVNQEQARELREFNLALSEQQERTAKAERALLEERQHSANRDMPVEAQKELSAKLSKFAGQAVVVDVFPVTFESRWLATMIHGILVNAKWDIVPSLNLLSTPPDPMVQGVYICSTADGKSQAAAKALYDLLGNTVASGLLDTTPLPDPGRPRVRILVGDKPTPLRTWVQ